MKYKAGDYVLYDDGKRYALAFIEKVDITSKKYFAAIVDKSQGSVGYIGELQIYEAYLLDNETNVDHALVPVSNNPYTGVSNELMDIYNQHKKYSQFTFRDSSKPSEKHKCTCVLFDVMNYGCKCGGV